jgi:hypothetical protein
MKRAMIALIALAVGACASPQTARPEIPSDALAAEQQRQSLFVLENRAADYRRVYDIAERLYAANTELCPRTAPMIGIRFENLNDYGRDFREAARSLWAIGDQPSVAWIAAESPAAEAGLHLRDQLVSIDGQDIRPGRRSSRQAAELLEDASEDGVVLLRVLRGSETLTLTVAPRETCAYQFYLVDADEVNAAADGHSIYLNRGMLRFVRTDEELALILGHELAHNAMRHIESAQTNALVGTIGGAMLDVLAAAGGVNTGGAFADAGGDIGRMMFSQQFESEADYVGLYFAARAGFDITGSEDFWRRMAAENPRGIRFAYSHPNFAERYLGLAAARQEITLKMARGEPLRPNLRGDERSSSTTQVMTAPVPAGPTAQEPAPTGGSPQTPLESSPTGDPMAATSD